MRLATITTDHDYGVAVIDDDRALPIDAGAAGGAVPPGAGSMRELAAGGAAGITEVRAWADRQPATAWRPLADVRLGPVVPDPGAIYTVGLNYRDPGAPVSDVPDQPLIYGKAPTSVAAGRETLTWDHALTANVDAEVELGVVIGAPAWRVAPRDAARHVFGYTCINDVSSRDPWLDGDQWLLGKSMPGFCPVGPWLVTTDELDPADRRLRCTVNGAPIQDGTTADMRFSIPKVIAYLSRHIVLRPGDLIATGTPARLETPPGPERHLEPGDEVAVWIEGIGELTTIIGSHQGGRP
jgi:2-keto-4-pentenoate hydratase/2-oxohepta-3-ene-1,7-dioic acid hydratase in catechol pathway